MQTSWKSYFYATPYPDEISGRFKWTKTKTCVEKIFRFHWDFSSDQKIQNPEREPLNNGSNQCKTYQAIMFFLEGCPTYVLYINLEMLGNCI